VEIRLPIKLKKGINMKKNYEVTLIVFGVILSVVGTIIKLIQVGKDWSYVIMWIGWIMIGMGIILLLIRKSKKLEK